MTASSGASRILVLDGHPDATSVRAGLAAAASEAAQARCAEVRLLNLSAMVFDPNVAGGYKIRQEMEHYLVAFLESLRWCDMLILVHPIWCGAAPAKLKGLIDQVFLPGITFD
jgi:putative NADPH-quinone reductase